MLNNDNNKRSKILHSQLPLVAIIVVAVCVYLAHKFQSSVLKDTSVVNGIGNIGLSKFEDHICTMIKMPRPNKDPPVSPNSK